MRTIFNNKKELLQKYEEGDCCICLLTEKDMQTIQEGKIILIVNIEDENINVFIKKGTKEEFERELESELERELRIEEMEKQAKEYLLIEENSKQEKLRNQELNKKKWEEIKKRMKKWEEDKIKYQSGERMK